MTDIFIILTQNKEGVQSEMTKLQEGMTVFYIEDSNVYSGQVIDMEETPEGGFKFSINSYGTCEGHYRISSGQIGKRCSYLRSRPERIVENRDSVRHVIKIPKGYDCKIARGN